MEFIPHQQFNFCDSDILQITNDRLTKMIHTYHIKTLSEIQI